jgi:hypothetical protein
LIVVSDDPDIPATTTVTTVRSPFGHVGFATKAHTSRTAVTGLGVQLGGIDEGGHPCILRRALNAASAYATSVATASSKTS